MTEQRVRRRFTVRGRVQGVGFRWATAEEAQRLGVAGWVRNLDDGSVVAEAEGERASVQALLNWLRHGPAMARVDAVDAVDLEPTGQRGFTPR